MAELGSVQLPLGAGVLDESQIVPVGPDEEGVVRGGLRRLADRRRDLVDDGGYRDGAHNPPRVAGRARRRADCGIALIDGQVGIGRDR